MPPEGQRDSTLARLQQHVQGLEQQIQQQMQQIQQQMQQMQQQQQQMQQEQQQQMQQMQQRLLNPKPTAEETVLRQRVTTIEAQLSGEGSVAAGKEPWPDPPTACTPALPPQAQSQPLPSRQQQEHQTQLLLELKQQQVVLSGIMKEQQQSQQEQREQLQQQLWSQGSQHSLLQHQHEQLAERVTKADTTGDKGGVSGSDDRTQPSSTDCSGALRVQVTAQTARAPMEGQEGEVEEEALAKRLWKHLEALISDRIDAHQQGSRQALRHWGGAGEGGGAGWE